MHIRLRGALLLAGCMLFYAMLFTSVLLNGIDTGSDAAGTALLCLALIGLPAVIALIGLMELLTGVACRQLPGHWRRLDSPRRLLLASALAGSALTLASIGVLLLRWLGS